VNTGLTLRRWHRAGVRAGQRLLRIEPTRYVPDRSSEYEHYWRGAAQLMGATFETLRDGVWEVGLNGNRTRLLNYLVQMDDPVTLELGGDKEFGCELAIKAGLPVPPYASFSASQFDRATSYIRSHPGPFVVKPARGSSAGMGVTTEVHTRRQLLAAFALATLYSRRIIVQRMVFAESCRLLYVDGEFVHAVRRRGARVGGDDHSSVRQLLSQAGIDFDALVLATLATQKLPLEFVPSAGSEIVVRSVPAGERQHRELRTIYDEDITPLVGSSLTSQCAQVVRDLGSRLAGVDVLTNDPSTSLHSSAGAFLELNTTPGLHHHYVTEKEVEQHEVARKILSRLLCQS
jgi:hypothetical protein